MHEEKFEKLSLYVVAHADDWQIFMNPNAYNDLISSGSKVVFIVTTAGDGGYNEKFWRAREEGNKSSIRYCLAPLLTLSEFGGTMQFNNHVINYWSANHVTCYFLRLPDGNLNGKGFVTYNYQSMSGLRSKELDNIETVDHSTTYTSWLDFTNTLEHIVKFESAVTKEVFINYLNPDSSINVNDHMDHVETGRAIQNMTVISTLRQALFVGYSIINTQKNLSPEELFWKAGMLAAYEKAVYDGSGYSTLKESPATYLGWCIRSAEFMVTNSIR